MGSLERRCPATDIHGRPSLSRTRGHMKKDSAGVTGEQSVDVFGGTTLMGKESVSRRDQRRRWSRGGASPGPSDDTKE